VTATGTAADLNALYRAWNQPSAGISFDDLREETRRLACLILAAPLGTQVGDLTISHAGWSKERASHADSVADSGADTEAWLAALGAHEHATLTADGRAAVRDQWCRCATEPAARQIPDDEWIRYEGWGEAGRTGHGFVHSTCRNLLQTG